MQKALKIFGVIFITHHQSPEIEQPGKQPLDFPPSEIAAQRSTDGDFTDAHLVINGASKLMRDVFGKEGRHARTTLGMAQLPLGASVDVEIIFELNN